jgi:hypothetical protein
MTVLLTLNTGRLNSLFGVCDVIGIVKTNKPSVNSPAGGGRALAYWQSAQQADEWREQQIVRRNSTEGNAVLDERIKGRPA